MLIARLQAVIRRNVKNKAADDEGKNDTIRIHSLTVDPGRHDGVPVEDKDEEID